MAATSNANQGYLFERFHALDSVSSIAELIDVDLEFLKYLLYVMSNDDKYRQFSIPKKNGGTRQIMAPTQKLKLVQSRLNPILQAVYKQKRTVHGFLPGRSIVSNARVHAAKRFLFNIDIEDFFPSINFGRVRGMFMARPYGLSPQVATVLAQICCFQNELPQGAPTSPIVSNMICGRMDDELARLALDEGWAYTRYADDLSFSALEPSDSFAVAYFRDKYGNGYSLQSIEDGKQQIWLRAVVGQHIGKIIRSNGFRVNPKKIRLQVNWQHQEVTGLTINQFPNVHRRYVRQIRAMLHAWRKYGFEAAQKEYLTKHQGHSRDVSTEYPLFKKVLKGKIDFVGMVKGKNDSVYIGLWNQLVELAPDLGKPKVLMEGIVSTEVNIPIPRIYTEGKTDWKHLKAAFSQLQRQGKFKDLKISLDEQTESRGDQELLRLCTNLSKVEQKIPVICIFDRDNSEIVSKVTGPRGFRNWGNNVFSLAIPVPKHRRDQPNVCIELYYRDRDIMTPDENGRRLFLSSEFNNKSFRHHDRDANLNCADRNIFKGPQPKIVDHEVYDSHNRDVALSKNTFADRILDRRPIYRDINFTAFEKIFEIIEDIVDNLG